MATAAAAKQDKTKSRVNSIGGFFEDKVVGDVMRNYLLTAKVPADKVDPNVEEDRTLAMALTLYFREGTSENDMAKCERCAGEAPASIVNCPFCGLEGETDEDDDDEDEEAKPESAPAPKKTAAAKKAEKAEKAEKNDKTEDAMQTQANGSGTKKASTALATTGNAKPVKAEPEPRTEIVMTADDLDKAVERVRKLKVFAAKAAYALGHELLAINEQKLWKLRLGEKGKAKYTSFDQFVEQECQISHTHAYNLISIAKDFTEEDMNVFGTTKLAIMLKAPEEVRPALKEKAKTHSANQLRQEARKAAEERGHTNKKKKHARDYANMGKKGAKATATKKTTKAASDKITIATIEGKKIVNLFAKPDSMRNIDWGSLKRAKTIDAQPFGRLELTNEVTMTFALVKNDAGLQLKIDIRRDVSGDSEE